MKAIILVGGEGTRLRPLTYTTPKAMVPILNIPFIQHVTSHLNKHKINEIVLSMGYKPDKIKQHFETNRPVSSKIIYNIETTPLGTAGAVKFAQRHIKSGERFFVMNGDIFTDLDLTGMLNFHIKKKASVTIALTPVEDPSQFGVVEIDERQRVKRFVEKPKKEEAPSNLINAGFYIIEPEILDRIPENKFFMFERDVFPKLIEEGEPVFGYISNAYWIDVGTPDKYLRVNCDLLAGKCSTVNMNDYKHSILKTGNRLEEQVLIAKSCQIGDNVDIKGPAVIGPDCVIGDGCYIEESVLWSGVHLARNVKVINCIIADNNSIEENSTLENEVINRRD